MWIINLFLHTCTLNCRILFELSNIFSRLLLDGGADRNILTDEGERPVDLVDPGDSKTIAVMLGPLEKKRWRHSSIVVTSSIIVQPRLSPKPISQRLYIFKRVFSCLLAILSYFLHAIFNNFGDISSAAAMHQIGISSPVPKTEQKCGLYFFSAYLCIRRNSWEK